MQDIVSERKRAAHASFTGEGWFGKVAEFEQGQNRCCQHYMTGKQTVLLYSASTIMRRLHRWPPTTPSHTAYKMMTVSVAFGCFQEHKD